MTQLKAADYSGTGELALSERKCLAAAEKECRCGQEPRSRL